MTNDPIKFMKACEDFKIKHNISFKPLKGSSESSKINNRLYTNKLWETIPDFEPDRTSTYLEFVQHVLYQQFKIPASRLFGI
jgi:hypothetical protein